MIRSRYEYFRVEDVSGPTWPHQKIYNWKHQREIDKINSMTDEEYAYWKYQLRVGKDLNLKQPRTYDEKVWYLKINVRDPLMNKCTDKYRVREYVTQCGLGHILNTLYGVFDSVEEVDFSKLPSPCFLKCNNTSGYNMLYDKTKEFDYEKFRQLFSEGLKTIIIGQEENGITIIFRPRFLLKRYL